MRKNKFIVFVFAAAIPATALAAEGGPSWEQISLWGGAALVALVGVHAKSLAARVNRHEEKISSLTEMILGDYHNKNEINNMLMKIEQSVGAVHRRLDHAGFKQATKLYQQDAD